jgi:hypothetical protein
VEILKWLHEAMHRKVLNLGLMIGFSTMTMLQLTRHTLSSSLWPENQLLNWNTHPIPLIWLQMISVSKNKICLKGMKISRCLKTSRKCDNVTKSCSTTGVLVMFPPVAASLG